MGTWAPGAMAVGRRGGTFRFEEVGLGREFGGLSLLGGGVDVA